MSSEPVRLPSGLEVAALIRRVNAEGGFATVLARGEDDAGAILVVITFQGKDSKVYERMPDLDGHRVWHCALRQDAEKPEAFGQWLERRRARDPDLWIVELDVAKGERFIDL